MYYFLFGYKQNLKILSNTIQLHNLKCNIKNIIALTDAAAGISLCLYHCLIRYNRISVL